MESSAKLENGEFENLVCEMLLPLNFVENLENLEENSTSVIYLLKIKEACEELLRKNEKMKNITSDILKLGDLQR
jgi:hypothetical protein